MASDAVIQVKLQGTSWWVGYLSAAAPPLLRAEIEVKLSPEQTNHALSVYSTQGWVLMRLTVIWLNILQLSSIKRAPGPRPLMLVCSRTSRILHPVVSHDFTVSWNVTKSGVHAWKCQRYSGLSYMDLQEAGGRLKENQEKFCWK